MTLKLGISSCLLGEKVRYDGGHKLDHYLKDVLGPFVEWVAVCPEFECGLGIPREAMHLVGDPKDPSLITIRTRRDISGQMKQWISMKVNQLEKEDLCGFIFKKGSPSSGLTGVKVYTEAGFPAYRGMGMFTRAFIERFPLLPVEDEGRLNDPVLKENFLTRVFVYRRWRDFETQNLSWKGLIRFHTQHKLLVMAHSPKVLTELGRVVAEGNSKKVTQIKNAYIQKLMTGLALIATVKKNTNVLYHIMGYFKKVLSSDEKQELDECFRRYHDGFVPLIVPLTLLNHYVRKYQDVYLSDQVYLNPHPAELMLRNHV